MSVLRLTETVKVIECGCLDSKSERDDVMQANCRMQEQVLEQLKVKLAHIAPQYIWDQH